MHEDKLVDIPILEIKDLIVKDPTIISSDKTIKELFEAIIADSRSRHAYVTDADNRLIGSVRINQVIQYLFPTLVLQSSNLMQISSFLEFSNAKEVGDIMNKNPQYVYEQTPIKHLIEIMISEKTNELPVVDKNLKLIGEVNVMEIIAKQLEFQK